MLADRDGMEMPTEMPPRTPADPQTALSWPDARRDCLPRHRFDYRGVPCRHSPVELSLFLKLLFRLCPATVVDLDAGYGGSALFFADQCQAMGLTARVIAVRPRGHQPMHDQRIECVQANARAAAPGGMASHHCLPRPLLVVADRARLLSTEPGVAGFLHDGVVAGDAIVIEDAGLTARDRAATLSFGHAKCRACSLAGRPGDYRVMTEYVAHPDPTEPPMSLNWLWRTETVQSVAA